MIINILAIESSRPKWSKDAFDEYSSRFNNSIKVKWNGIKPVKRLSNSNINQIKDKEGQALLSQVKSGGLIICLDQSGISWNNKDLKSEFQKWQSYSGELYFLIGGPDGLSSECLKKSSKNWSLSFLTFPHAIVPVMLIEQIYRSWSMTMNHPYHR